MLAEKWSWKDFAALFPASSRMGSAIRICLLSVAWGTAARRGLGIMLCLHRGVLGAGDPLAPCRRFVLPRVSWETILDSPGCRSSLVRIWYSNKICREDALPLNALPLGHFSWRCIFSWSKCRRQGSGLYTALSPYNCHTVMAQSWCYLCQGLSCPRKLAGSRDGFPWA